jgi:hypothetical protein
MSIPSTTPLTPDDEQPGVTLTADRRQRDVEEHESYLYVCASVIFTLWLLLILRSTHLSIRSDLVLAALLGVLCYLLFLRTLPHLKANLLAMLAAVLGLLYGLPYLVVYHMASYTLFLLCGALLALVAGSILSAALQNEERSYYPVVVSFLIFFVLGNIVTLMLSHWLFNS